MKVLYKSFLLVGVVLSMLMSNDIVSDNQNITLSSVHMAIAQDAGEGDESTMSQVNDLVSTVVDGVTDVLGSEVNASATASYSNSETNHADGSHTETTTVTVTITFTKN